LVVLRGSAPPGRGLWQGENFWLTASAQCLRLSERFFHSFYFGLDAMALALGYEAMALMVLALLTSSF